MTSQTQITRCVRHYLSDAHLSVVDLSKLSGIKTRALYDRLAGRIRWSLDDLDALIDAGVPIELRMYGAVTWEVPA